VVQSSLFKQTGFYSLPSGKDDSKKFLSWKIKKKSDNSNLLYLLCSFKEGAIPEVFARRCRCVGTLSQNILAKGEILLKENNIKKPHNISTYKEGERQDGSEQVLQKLHRKSFILEMSKCWDII